MVWGPLEPLLWGPRTSGPQTGAPKAQLGTLKNLLLLNFDINAKKLCLELLTT